MREKCTQSKNCQKVVTRHVWAEYMEKAEDYRHTPQYKKIYAERKQTIERVFACAKEQHGMRYTHLRGLARVTSQLTLLFASMNLKKLATWKDRNGLLCLLEKLLIIVKGYFRIPKVPFLSTVCSSLREGAPYQVIFRLCNKSHPCNVTKKKQVHIASAYP